MRWHSSRTKLNSAMTQTFYPMTLKGFPMSTALSLSAAQLLVFYSFLEGKGREATNAKSQATSLIVYRENGECAFAPTTILPVVSEL